MQSELIGGLLAIGLLLLAGTNRAQDFGGAVSDALVRTAINLTGSAIDGVLANMEDHVQNTTEPREKCNTLMVLLGENEMMVSRRPIGYCNYCCKAKAHINIRFYVFTRDNPTTPKKLQLLRKPGAAREAGINPQQTTVFYIHGFTEYGLGMSGRTIRDAYLNATDHNVVLVDWGDLVALPWYVTAVRNTKLMGQALGKFLAYYHDTGEIPIDTVHLIGFSLGAQVAGYTGKFIRKGLTIPHITALDAAYPIFNNMGAKDKLNAYDALFVDAIHTDGGNLGMPNSYAHVDFFPNGGRALQPGCHQSQTPFLDMDNMHRFVACSHLRAWQFYAESVRNPKAFPATRCKQWSKEYKECEFTIEAYMGFGITKKETGNYFLLTHEKSPYSMRMKEQKRMA